MGNFKIHSKFKPMGDQPVAIESLVSGLNKNEKFLKLLQIRQHMKLELSVEIKL